MRHRRTLEDMEPDPPLTEEQKRLVAALSAAQLVAVDTALLRNVGTQWRKVAMVVGMTMHDLEGTFANLPDIFFSMRVQGLVQGGSIEAQGDLQRMRFSEVRRTRREI